eukprot:gnl/MRDRNA2_/MRDRNA2_270588_c0_seq1.p1 gnl/MRDRNA2_/MRDRNA2_270588_c0~~gnl/MRDRNA2_/MRDRNA2_270588_c0_seq1.p1  ORF type:complete len:102 (-),score=18.34 gnl/MRDRNA2_/MRDRNA2_270588_c0_seq1:399-704(-)
MAMLRWSLRRHVKANEVAYSIAISLCDREARWKMVLPLLCEMRRTSAGQSTVSHDTAISACGRAGRWQAASCLMQDMFELLLQVSEISCNATISAGAKGDH